MLPKATRMKLKFVDPIVQNGKKLAKINEGDVALGIKRWENAVVAYILDYHSDGKSNLPQLLCNERNYANVKIYWKGSYVFMLDFETTQAKESALADGPWFYGPTSKIVVLKPWNRDFSFEISDLKSAPVWINLYNLRMHLWSPEAVSKIASLVGRPLFADPTIDSKYMKFWQVRICVEVDFDTALPNSVTIEDDKGCVYNLDVGYEWLPIFRCPHCQQLGHSGSCSNIKTGFR